MFLVVLVLKMEAVAGRQKGTETPPQVSPPEAVPFKIFLEWDSEGHGDTFQLGVVIITSRRKNTTLFF